MTNQSTPQGLHPDDADELLAETRSLRRRVEFWQRIVWLILGACVILTTVIWQRGELRSRECFQALLYYSGQARRLHLADQHPAIFEQQWQSLEAGPVKITPIHYDLIVENWKITPKPGEILPLAVCRDSHLLLFTQGRHVLLRDENGMHIEWRSEPDVRPIVDLAAKDNHR